MSVEEREQARSEWFQQNPQAQSITKANKAKRKWRVKMGKLKQDHPELYEKFKSEKSKWKKLSQPDRRAAKQEFMKAHPEIRKALQGEKKVGHAYGKLKESNQIWQINYHKLENLGKLCSQNNVGKPKKVYAR